MTQEIEIWKPYKQYHNANGTLHIITDIEVSNLGNVRGNLWNNKPLEIYIMHNRRRVSNSTTGQIFKLVWRVFNGDVPCGYVIHHKDFNSLNDRLDNLEMMERSEHIRLHRLNNKEQNKKISSSLKEYCENHPEYAQYISERMKQYYENNPEAKEEISRRNKNNKSLTDYRWYNNGIETKLIKLGDFIPEGFKPGRILIIKSTKKYHWYNDGNKNVKAETCPEGFVPGRIFCKK